MNYLLIDRHFSVRRMVQDEQILSCLESGLRFLTDSNFPLWLTWEMVQIVDVS
jgi:hypothetical protein